MSSSFPNPLTEKEEQHYVKLLEQGDPAARKALIEHNLRLVAHIAKNICGSGCKSGRPHIHWHHRPDKSCRYIFRKEIHPACHICGQMHRE